MAAHFEFVKLPLLFCDQSMLKITKKTASFQCTNRSFYLWM